MNSSGILNERLKCDHGVSKLLARIDMDFTIASMVLS